MCSPSSIFFGSFDNNEQLIVGSEEMSLFRSIQFPRIFCPSQSWFGTSRGETFNHGRLSCHNNLAFHGFHESKKQQTFKTVNDIKYFLFTLELLERTEKCSKKCCRPDCWQCTDKFPCL